MTSRDFDLREQKWRHEVSSVAVQFRKRGELKSFLFMLFLKTIVILTFLSSSTS